MAQKRTTRKSTLNASKRLGQGSDGSGRVDETLEHQLHARSLRERYAHAHLYYGCAVVSASLSLFSLIQGILFHARQGGLEDPTLSLSLAFFCYLIGGFFFAIAWRCVVRGKRHYLY